VYELKKKKFFFTEKAIQSERRTLPKGKYFSDFCLIPIFMNIDKRISAPEFLKH
jgi:hypothetical protein